MVDNGAVLSVRLSELVDGATVVGAVAGIGAAVFAFFAWFSTVRASRTADRRHMAEIQPRPLLNIRDGSAVGEKDEFIEATIANAGGAAPKVAYLVQAHEVLYLYIGSLPEHCLAQVCRINRIAILDRDRPFRVVWGIAQDVDGNWWDVYHRERIRASIDRWLQEVHEAQDVPLSIKLDDTEAWRRLAVESGGLDRSEG
jgi:hypothetical protein